MSSGAERDDPRRDPRRSFRFGASRRTERRLHVATVMSTYTTDLGRAGLLDVLEDGRLTLVKWWAPRRSRSRAFAQTYERVAAEHPDVVFASVNAAEERELARTFRVLSVPTLMVFRDRIMLFEQAGPISEAALRGLVRQARALDMDEVREQIADPPATPESKAS